MRIEILKYMPTISGKLLILSQLVSIAIILPISVNHLKTNWTDIYRRNEGSNYVYVDINSSIKEIPRLNLISGFRIRKCGKILRILEEKKSRKICSYLDIKQKLTSSQLFFFFRQWTRDGTFHFCLLCAHAKVWKC